MTSAKVAPWNKRDSDGRWKRKLVGAEKMFEDWLVIDGWCEWVACVHFTDKGQMVDDAFKRAVAALSLERPSLMASIERPESDGPLFVYQPLSSMAELERRTAEITQVVEVKGSLDAGVEDILDRFYSETDKRISIEMGSSLLHLYLVHSASDSKTGKYALLLRSHHALNDFLSGMSIFDGLLAKIGHREGPDESLLSTAVQRLHPCYLDLLRDPIDHHSATEAELAQGSETMGKQMNNITFWPNKQEPAGQASTADYAVRRKTFSTETTSRLISICKEHGVTVTALLLTIQTLAVLMTFPPPDENRREAMLNLVSNRLSKTTLSDVTADETEVGKGASHLARKRAQRAAAAGPIMATNFVIAPCNVGDYVDAKKRRGQDAWKECLWKVAEQVKRTLQDSAPQTVTEKAYWTEGPTGFGLIAMALGAMKSGAAPVAPGVFTSLSAPGVLDGIHLQERYGDSVILDDVAFYPRVSTYFGGQTWAWTALGKLNTIVVRPDPRKCSSEKTEWWDLNNRMIEEVAQGGL